MNFSATVILTALAIGLAGCQQSGGQRNKGPSPQSIMVKVAQQAQACWFVKKDPAFGKYRMATELNSPAGRPRILIVPKNNPRGLPKLVVQAERVLGIAGVSTFGPLLDTQDGERIQAAITKWAGGSQSC